MPRPKKHRRVCRLPANCQFAPVARGRPLPGVVMRVEKYETVRLIDFCGFTQAQCARQMRIARTTAQGIYARARQKLACCLTEGRPLQIKGGAYQLCEGSACPRCPGCPWEKGMKPQPNPAKKPKEKAAKP